MRNINMVVVHCSATKENEDYTVSDIRQMHVRRGFNDIGYHFLIRLDGTVEKGRDIDKVGAHAKGYNKKSIGICYVGGLDRNGKPKDTRTPKQDAAILELLNSLVMVFPSITKIKGHRDLSPDLNNNGIIEPKEYMKECPCFDAIDEYKFLLK